LEIEDCEFPGVSRAIAANSIHQARGHRHAAELKRRNTAGDSSRNRRIFRIWISVGHGHWCSARRDKRSHYAVLDWNSATCANPGEELMVQTDRNLS